MVIKYLATKTYNASYFQSERKHTIKKDAFSVCIHNFLLGLLSVVPLARHMDMDMYMYMGI